MPASALGLALAAAFLHALWNLLLVRARDIQAATTAGLCIAVVLFAPAAAAGWRVDAGAVPWIAGSAVLELVYFILLTAAYSRAELSLVYPVARGAAPVLVLVGATAAGHTPTALEAVGVVVVAAGIVLVRGSRRGPARGLLLALAIAATIAGYTLVDKEGIRHAAAIPYLELVLLPVALAAVARVGVGRTRALVGPVTAGVGVATLGAYALVLLALRLAPAAPVAAVRETGIVIAVGLAAIVLRERVGIGRLAGAALVAAGVALLSLA